MSTRRQRALAWLPALGYMLLIWALSSIPTQLRFNFVPFQDKGVHFLEYGALAALLAHAVRGTWTGWRALRILGVAWAAAVMWGLLDEIHQAFVPGRIADASDLAADALGALIGAGLYVVLRERSRRRTS